MYNALLACLRACVLACLLLRGIWREAWEEVIMNRIEALNVLGLDSDATERDIKVAYRECAQILHPDRFASNAKLQDRATEQFKRLQDAYEYLTGDKARRTSASGSRSSAPSGAKASYRAVEARLAGLAAAKVQLTAQRDALVENHGFWRQRAEHIDCFDGHFGRFETVEKGSHFLFSTFTFIWRNYVAIHIRCILIARRKHYPYR